MERMLDGTALGTSRVKAEPAVRGGDRAVVERARSGDRLAFDRLHRDYARMVHGLLLARVPHGDVEDLVQEVFLKAWQHLGSLREPLAFGGWLAMLARNHALDHMRTRRETRELPAGLVAPDDDAARSFEALEAIRGLPEAYRDTLMLRLVEGLSGPEIADLTGMTAGSVRVNLHRGMKLLRERLTKGTDLE